MNKYKTLVFALILILLLLANCSPQRPVVIPTTPTVFTGQEIETLMPTRISESPDTLMLSVKINNIEISEKPNENPHIITLDIDFKNKSGHSIVLKKPRSTGFTGQGLMGYPIMFNDVGIVIQRKDGTEMGVPFSSQLIARPPAKDSQQAFLYHRPEDFIVLENGEAFSYTFIGALPIVLFEGETSATELPSGTYTLFLAYRNDFIGYQPPVDATATVNFDYFYGPTAQIVDLNAWVGSLVSNKVEFTIPN